MSGLRARLLVASRDRRRDEGLSLIEAVMYCLLLPVVLLIVSALLITIYHTKTTVSTVSAASNAMQSSVDSVENGIRSSSAWVLATNGSDQLLKARVATGPSTFVCETWYWSSSTKQLRYMTSSTAIATPSNIALSTWHLLADGVTPLSGSTIFGGTYPTVTIALAVAATNSPAAQVRTQMVSRSENKTGGSCFTA